MQGGGKGKGVSAYVQGKEMGTHDTKRKRIACNGKELQVFTVQQVGKEKTVSAGKGKVTRYAK